MRITLISATNRPGSQTRRLAGFIETLFKERLSPSDQLQFLDLQELPPEIFHPSSYTTKPASFQKFADMVVNTDGIFCVVPEYNGGFPGVFKYFIDMLPFPQSIQKKPAAFVGHSDGRFGALRPVEQMQQIWEYRNAYLYPERVFIPQNSKNLDTNGKPTDATTLKLLIAEVEGFINFTKRFV